jgi:hypothetical protein
MNEEGIIVCEECGCDKVQTVTWVEINSKIVHGAALSESADENDNWCPQCDSHCSVTSLAIYKTRDQEDDEEVIEEDDLDAIDPDSNL